MRAEWHWGYSVANDVSGVSGKTPEYLTVPTHMRLCVSRLFASLATRGNTMKSLERNGTTYFVPMEATLWDSEGQTTATTAKRALMYSDGVAVVGKAPASFAGSLKRNRSDAKKRRTKKLRDSTQAGFIPASEPSVTLKTLAGGKSQWNVGNKCRKGSNKTSRQ